MLIVILKLMKLKGMRYIPKEKGDLFHFSAVLQLISIFLSLLQKLEIVLSHIAKI